MALGKAKQIERSPPQRLCSASNRCECRQLVLLQQPRSCDDRCRARGARAEQHPCPGGAPRHRRGPPGITLPLSLPPSRHSPAPAAARCGLRPARPAGVNAFATTHATGRERPCRYTCSYIMQGFGGSSRIILSAEIGRSFLGRWRVIWETRAKPLARYGTAGDGKTCHGGPVGQPRLREHEQHRSQRCHALVQGRKSEKTKIKTATSEDSSLIRKSRLKNYTGGRTRGFIFHGLGQACPSAALITGGGAPQRQAPEDLCTVDGLI